MPEVSFAVCVTGHRASHPSYPADPAVLAAVMEQVFAEIDDELARQAKAISEFCLRPTRLLTLLSDGVDHLAVRAGVRRAWELVIPLPFGLALNAAINAAPASLADTRAILAGKAASDPAVAQRIVSIAELAEQGSLFELGDDDERLSELLLKALEQSDDPGASAVWSAEAGKRAALAGRVLIEQSDLVIAIWDGQSTANVGGTGHTVLMALKAGLPVLAIDPAQPDHWRVLNSPEELAKSAGEIGHPNRKGAIAQVIEGAVALHRPGTVGTSPGLAGLKKERWRAASRTRSHSFRRVEALFGETGWQRKFASIRHEFEHPDAIADGSGRNLLGSIRSLTPGNSRLADGIADQILTRFAWLDAISAQLADRHRSGMTINFILGACAIIGGILYLPLVEPEQKWIFAGIELTFLLAILANTAAGRGLRLHSRWFETRRAAEYLRHSPMLCALGVGRPAPAWPRGTGTWWPEWYVRNSVRAVGLPNVRVDKSYLRRALESLRDHHVVPQRDYHRAKANRLTRAHHGLDIFSERLFVSAVFVVALYLVLSGLTMFGMVNGEWLTKASKWFTVLAVALPTLGGALAGIRYFGDFERFAEISEVTAEKLDIVASRIDTLLAAPESTLTYSLASDIMRATDDVVFAEIQAWQSVFSGKIIAVPA